MIRCPYCQSRSMPWPPRRGNRVYVACVECGKKSLAKFSGVNNDDVIVEYVATRNHVTTPSMVMLTVRVKPETYQRARKAGSKKLREILEKGLGDE